MTGFNLARLTSVHGLRMGLNSTGALILNHNGTQLAAMTMSSADHVQNSSAATINAFASTRTEYLAKRAQSVINDIQSTLTHGFTVLTSGASADVAITGWEMEEPYLGAEAEIYFQGSASNFHLGGTSTGQIFASSDETSDAGSTLFVSGVDLRGVSIRLRGISTLQWAVMDVTQSASQVNPINGVSGASTVVIG